MEPVGTLRPHELLTSRKLGEQFGVGYRYHCQPLLATGYAAGTAKMFDAPDPAGAMDMVAKIPGEAAFAPQSTAAQSVVPTGPSGEAAWWKEMAQLSEKAATRAEDSRSNDFKAFVELMKAQNGGDSSGKFYATELALARSRISDLEGRIERMTTENFTLKLRIARGSDGDGPDMLTTLAAGAGEKFGFLPVGTVDKVTGGRASMPGGAAVEDDKFVMPDPETLAASLRGAGPDKPVEMKILRAAVKMRKANALSDAHWEKLEPIAELLGLV